MNQFFVMSSPRQKVSNTMDCKQQFSSKKALSYVVSFPICSRRFRWIPCSVLWESCARWLKVKESTAWSTVDTHPVNLTCKRNWYRPTKSVKALYLSRRNARTNPARFNTVVYICYLINISLYIFWMYIFVNKCKPKTELCFIPKALLSYDTIPCAVCKYSWIKILWID